MGANGPSRSRRHAAWRWKEEQAGKARKHADALECEAFNERMMQLGGPIQPSPTLGTAMNGGYAWVRVECNACQQTAWVDLTKIRRRPDTPIWKLEASLVCQVCRRGRSFAPRAKIEMLCQYDKQMGPSPFQERN